MRWIAVALAAITLLPAVPAAGGGTLQAGAAKIEITPPEGVPLNGLFARMGRGAIEVHDPIWARCLYLNDGKSAVFLVTADLYCIPSALRARAGELAASVLRDAKAEAASEPATFILTATGTHNAQGGMMDPLPLRFLSGPVAPDLVDAAAGGIADAMRDAYANRKRAAAGVSAGNAPGLTTHRLGDALATDNQIGVMRVDDPDGKPIAIVGHYAALPATADGDRLFSISSDFPGIFCTRLETEAGDGTVALFLTGAAGCAVPANRASLTGWAFTESVGDALAKKAWELAESAKCGDIELHATTASHALPPSSMPGVLPESTEVQSLEIRLVPAAPQPAAPAAEDPEQPLLPGDPKPAKTKDKPAPAPQPVEAPPVAPTLHVVDGIVTFQFTPGIPCVELGATLRRQALSRAYAAQFTVSCAGDFMGFFPTPEHYAATALETQMSYYGPGMDTWLLRAFADLMTLKPASGSTDAAAPAQDEAEAPEATDFAGGKRLLLAGNARQRGLDRAAAFPDALKTAYKQTVLTAFDTILAPAQPSAPTPPSVLNLLNKHVDLSRVAMPGLLTGFRSGLTGLAPAITEELAGMSETGGVPFDGVWIMQQVLDRGIVLAGQETPALDIPFALAAAATGARAGADDVLAGFCWDRPGEEIPLLAEIRPDAGKRLALITSPSEAGALAGMNENGVVICAFRTEPAHPLEIPKADPWAMAGGGSLSAVNGSTPVGMLIVNVLAESETADNAVVRLQGLPGLRGWHLLVVSPGGKKPMAYMLEFGPVTLTHTPEEGLLMGMAQPAADAKTDAAVDAAAKPAKPLEAEHAALFAKLKTERIVAAEEMDEALRAVSPPRKPAGEGPTSTRHVVVFQPSRGKISVAFASGDQALGEAEVISLEAPAKEKSHE